MSDFACGRLEPLEPQARQNLVLGLQVAQLMWLHVRGALFKVGVLGLMGLLAHTVLLNVSKAGG